MWSIALAFLAAGCNALSSVCQRKANLVESRRQPFGPRLLLTLLARPVWLLGAAAMIGSFLLQAAALSAGALSLVEPVLVLELPLAIILGAVVLHRRLHTRDWLAAAVMAAGLGLFIGVLAPGGGDARHVSTTLALVAAAATVGGVGVVVLVAQLGPGQARAALLGVAAGSGFGLTAGMMKLAVARIPAGGIVGVLTGWQTYAMIALGVGSLTLVQAALNAGTLVAAQPGITLLDPLVSVLWGIVVIGEQVRSGPILALAGAGAAAIVVAVVSLARAAAAG